MNFLDRILNQTFIEWLVIFINLTGIWLLVSFFVWSLGFVFQSLFKKNWPSFFHAAGWTGAIIFFLWIVYFFILPVFGVRV